MLRVWTNIIAFVTALLALPIWVIQAQLYDATDLTGLLTPPETCTPPCFLGIRPGETTLTDAALLLEAEPRLRFVVYSEEMNVHNSRVRINWDYRQRGRLVRGTIYFENYVARQIAIYGFPLAEVWLTLGPPDTSGVVIGDPLSQTGYYAALDLWVDSPTECLSFWQENARILWTASAPADRDQRLPLMDLRSLRQKACAALRHHPFAFQSGGFLNGLPQAYTQIVNHG